MSRSKHSRIPANLSNGPYLFFRFVTQAETVAAVAAGIIPCDTLPAPGLGAEAVLAIQQGLVLATAREHDPKYTVVAEPALKAYVATFPDNRVHGY